MLTAVIIIAVLIAALFTFIASRPNTFRVERSVHINASAERIFPLINDFQEWPKWSPYEKMDPAMKRTYSGAERGQGAIYAWEGNARAGSGRMEILEAAPSSLVRIQLDFTKPFVAHNTAEFALRPTGSGTTVTWAMYGPQAFMNKAMSLVMSMDSLVGGQFDEGLANLKRVSES
jgi:uncharacterized protein YndB with AHSA1/START domain